MCHDGIASAMFSCNRKTLTKASTMLWDFSASSTMSYIEFKNVAFQRLYMYTMYLTISAPISSLRSIPVLPSRHSSSQLHFLSLSILPIL